MDENRIVPDGAYEGYYWMSDASVPVVVRDVPAAEVNALLENQDANPFVVEGQMFCRATGDSVGIRYVDGKYIVSVFKVAEDLGKVKGGEYDGISLKRFHAHRMPGERLLFFQYWRPESDPLCADMPVLQPAEMVFVGFEPIN